MRTIANGALLLLLAIAFPGVRNALSSPAAAPAFLYTVAKKYEALAWVDGGERFPAGASIFIKDASGHRALVRSFVASSDPTVSFDGKNVLFSGKRNGGDFWQIWEISLDGGDPRQITNCSQDCVRPFYLPEDRIVYAGKSGNHFVIQSLAITGGRPLPLTYTPGSSLPTDVLQDGRILFEATSAVNGKLVSELYTVYSDGSGVESYRCDHGQARHSGKQLRSGDIVFALQRGLARFTSALAKEVPIPAPDGEYGGDVSESTSGDWLLPWRFDVSSQFQLMWWGPGQVKLRPALHEAGTNVVEPVLLGGRSIPKRHPSALHEWPVGNLLCLNAYTSKFKFPAGAIRAARLYTKDAKGSVQLLGTTPVERDGSFFVQIPGDQPMQIELLDGFGKTLRREAGWFWLRRGEQRVCVGCHAGPETAPENAVPMILQRSTTPSDMTHPVAASAGGH